MYAQELGCNTVRSHWYRLPMLLISNMHPNLIIFVDLLKITNVEHAVNKFSLPAEPQLNSWWYIGFPGNDHVYDPEAYIKVPIIHFEPLDFQSSRVILSADYYHRFSYVVQNTTQAISPKHVPPVDRLLQAYLKSRGNIYQGSGPFAKLSEAFRDFAESYCNKPGELPLVSNSA
jgi:hypothetical protein